MVNKANIESNRIMGFWKENSSNVGIIKSLNIMTTQLQGGNILQMKLLAEKIQQTIR